MIEARQWFHQLETRERRMVTVGGLLLFATILFLTVIEPLHEKRKTAVIRYHAAETLLDWMQEKQASVNALQHRLSGQKQRVPSEQLLSIINAGLKTAGIADNLKSISPEQNGAVLLRFDEVTFDAFIAWLIEFHNRFAIDVNSITVTRTSSAGMVTASLVLR